MTIGARLKRLRLETGASLQYVADAIKVSKSHIWDLETGKSKNPTLNILNKLADHYRVTVTDLVGEEEGYSDSDFVGMHRVYARLSDRHRKAVRAVVYAMQ